ncbi:FAD-dependent monooxygenase [Acetobacter sacchari]|uniref:FAD-dependent monooxygenase n=1 Tax=Acetobacter sacchari TaxID=2661687 RepID=A0ABS3LYN3_9PROT|nr:FAD-dependent monooxygenase [Acetobacter sacchari]MBO1361017.1 FAD-dependent monooxygenase [Acetobacter sacchari]
MTTDQTPAGKRRVLISGASIAGPALALWLDRYGFDVTVVERAPTIRTGGYPIDVRGTAIDVIERMKLLPQVRAAHVESRMMTFVDAQGDVIGSVPIYEAIGSDLSRDVELPRGTLASLLYDATLGGAVDYRFNESIETLRDDGDGVDIRFTSGRQERYDIVVGADGMHSLTRRLVFGPEAQFTRFLGFSFNIFTLPNDRGLSHGGVFHAEPGKVAGLFAVKESDQLFAFLTFVADDASISGNRDPQEQIRRTRAAFTGMGWELPRLLDAMEDADDLYFDTVSQIKMPSWSNGRVALLGDAAYAPSFRSGQGTSLALVGAYVLAGELATHDDPTDAFNAYDRLMRPFVEANQALATDGRGEFFLPRTRQDIEARDRMLAEIAKNGTANLFGDGRTDAHTALQLRDYPLPPL